MAFSVLYGEITGLVFGLPWLRVESLLWVVLVGGDGDVLRGAVEMTLGLF